MKKYIVLFLLFTMSGLLFSQHEVKHIKSVVYDKETKKPLSGVDVFFSGSSIFTETQEDGYFTLPFYTLTNAPLVVSLLGYENQYFASPFDQVPEAIYLQRNSIVLQEVEVNADRHSRKQLLETFRQHFLGTDKHGKSCEILNEDDIDIRYDQERGVITAKSDKPLLINNSYLGYELEYTLDYFEASYGADISLIFFGGYSFYRGLAMYKNVIDNRKFVKRRLQTYEGSPTHFFVALTQDALKKSNFKIVYKKREVPAEAIFRIKDNGGLKEVEVLLPGIVANDTVPSNTVPQDKPSIQIYYKNRRSEIYFLTDKFLVDGFGITSTPNELLFSGEFSQNVIGRSLPVNYGSEK